jgi:lipoprotein Spr
MLSMNSELAASPAKSALVHQEQARCARVFSINTRSGKAPSTGGAEPRIAGWIAPRSCSTCSPMRRILICRATSEQIHRGVQVAQYRLRAGDLVFFQTGPNRNVGGVYIGENQFIHASASQGVTVST